MSKFTRLMVLFRSSAKFNQILIPMSTIKKNAPKRIGNCIVRPKVWACYAWHKETVNQLPAYFEIKRTGSVAIRFQLWGRPARNMRQAGCRQRHKPTAVAVKKDCRIFDLRGTRHKQGTGYISVSLLNFLIDLMISCGNLYRDGFNNLRKLHSEFQVETVFKSDNLLANVPKLMLVTGKLSQGFLPNSLNPL